MAEFFWRSDPAAALRGFGASFWFVPARRSFSSRNPEMGRYTSPRTSITAGRSPSRRNGIALIVRRFGETSSPWTPSPRVAPRTNTPFSYVRLLRLEPRGVVDPAPRHCYGEHPRSLCCPDVERRVAGVGGVGRIGSQALGGEEKRLRVGLLLRGFVATDDRLEEVGNRNACE